MMPVIHQPGGMAWHYDRILLDVPCSAIGVIRRHPDIKLLRKPTDIGHLVLTQARLLRAMWPLLSPGGMLLYCTCSVLADENSGQIASVSGDTRGCSGVTDRCSLGAGMPSMAGRFSRVRMKWTDFILHV